MPDPMLLPDHLGIGSNDPDANTSPARSYPAFTGRSGIAGPPPIDDPHIFDNIKLDEKGRPIINDEQRAALERQGATVIVGTGQGMHGVRKE